jgi:hypothetical protein
MVRAVLEAADHGTPESTSRKDKGHWQRWLTFCRLFDTEEWRHDAAANSGADAALHVRETFLQTAFLVWSYSTMRPRRRKDPAAKPASASKALQAVRRIYAKRGFKMAEAPKFL